MRKHNAITDVMGAFDSLRPVIACARPLFLFADFDGTLSPIVSVPSAASIGPDVKLVLKRLCLDSGIVVTVLSGRSLHDVRSRVGLPLIYGGNHGLELEGPDFRHSPEGAEASKNELLSLCNELRDRLAPISGALVESKRLSASVHVRQVARADLERVAQVVRGAVERRRFEVRTGKEVLEIRPKLEWDKGTAVRWLLDRYGADESQAVCIGDDATDEEMFRAVPDAINVKVGLDCETCARYWMAESDVAQFLWFLLEAARTRRAPAAFSAA
jgi:trehalose 6-phosphate phosphatase